MKIRLKRLRNRLGIVLATLGLVLAGIVGVSTPAFASGDTLTCGYYGQTPSFSCDSFSGFSGQRPWSYPVDANGHNCTNYVTYRLWKNGVANPGNLGNANEWDNNAAAYGFTVNTTPAVGSVAQWEAYTGPATSSAGHVAYVDSINSDGSINTSEDNYGGTTMNRRIYAGSSDWPSHFIHFKDLANNGGSSYPDGTYITSSTTGIVYIMAGGAPVRVISWSDVGGSHTTTTVAQSTIDAMPQYPADGTFVTDYGTGIVYVFAGGAPTRVISWNDVGGSRSTTAVDDWAIQNTFPSYPADGTYVTDYSTGIVYEIVGGAALRVFNWSDVGGSQPSTAIDDWAIQNTMRSTPSDGTYATDYSTGIVYVFAGGAPVRVLSWSDVGGARSTVVIDHTDVTSVLPQYPADGTFVTDYGTGIVYEFIGEMPLQVSSWNDLGGWHASTAVDDWAIQNTFPSYPINGTYLKGYQSGDVFQASSGALTRISSGQPSNTVAVDDWAIVNVLGGTE